LQFKGFAGSRETLNHLPVREKNRSGHTEVTARLHFNASEGGEREFFVPRGKKTPSNSDLKTKKSNEFGRFSGEN
jgi:hypothetical protein